MGRGLRTALSAAVIAALVGGPIALAPPSAALQVPQTTVVSADPVNWTPHVLDGRVNAIAPMGDLVVVGGEFTQVQAATDTTVVARRNLFAFDRTTGAIDPDFVPVVDKVVTSLAPGPDGTWVLVGGAFSFVNGVASKGVAKLDVRTGTAVPGFSAKTDSRVNDIALSGNRLYLAGTFLTVKGVPRTGLAAVDVTTGAVDPSLDLLLAGPRGGGTLGVSKIDVTPDRSRMIAVGNFSSVAGVARHQIAMIDLTANPARLTNWETMRFEPRCSGSFDTYMRDVDFSPDGSWFVAVTTGAYFSGTLCDTASRWETNAEGSSLQPTWIGNTGGDTLYSVAITGTAVYVGGHQRWFNNPFRNGGAVTREGIAALDPLNGLPLSWNPGRTRGVGVFALVATSSELWVGSDTDRLGGFEYHARLGMFPLEGGTSVPAVVPATLPNDLYTAGLDDSLGRRPFDGATAGARTTIDSGAWSHARGAFMLNGRIYAGWDDGRMYSWSFDGTTLGAPAEIDLYALRETQFPVRSVTGMFVDGARLYYTVAGDPRLFSRWFTSESDIVGAETFVASGDADGLDWRNVSGITMAGGYLWYGSSDGYLRRIDFAGGHPVPGTAVVTSGPAIDGIDWRSRGLFPFSAPAGPRPAPNVAPTATLASSCNGLTCGFDATGSGDADGSVAAYHWDLGDGTTSTEAAPTYTYPVQGTYRVVLSVTDDAGAVTRRWTDVTAEPLPPLGFRAGTGSNRNASAHTVTVPSAVRAGDGMLLFASSNSSTTPIGNPTGVTGWSPVSTVTAGSMTTRVWQKVAAPGDAGRSLTITLGASQKVDVQLLAYSGTSATGPVAAVAGVRETVNRTGHTTPLVTTAVDGTWVVSYWAEKTSGTGPFTGPAEVVRSASTGSGSGHMSSLVTDADASHPAGTHGGLTATGPVAGNKATMFTVVLAPRA